MPRAAIIGTGFYVPDTVVTNEDLTRLMDTSDAWITERSGIKERRWVDIGPDNLAVENGSDMAVKASLRAIENAGIDRRDIDLVLYATLNPDVTFPGNGVFIEDKLELRTAGAMDIRNQCTGFIYGLAAADGFIRAGTARTILLIGAELHSTALDKTTRGRDIAVLFGDGAGAAILRPSNDPERGIISAKLGADGARAEAVWIPGGGSKHPSSHQTVDERAHYMKMNGRAIYKFAVTMMHQLVAETIEEQGISIDDIAYLIPHQSNLRIIESAAERLGMPMDRVAVNIDRYGNTSAASIAMALHEAVHTERIKRGDLVMLVAFGAGLTWGCVLMRI